MPRELLEPTTASYLWLGFILLTITLIIIAVVKVIVKKKSKNKTTITNFIAILSLLAFNSCTSSEIIPEYDINELTNEFNLQDLDDNKQITEENALYFETAIDAKEFLQHIKNNGTIKSYSEKHTEFLISNPKFKSSSSNFNYAISPDEIEFTDKNTRTKSFYNYHFTQYYMTLGPYIINSLHVSLHSQNNDAYTVGSGIEGYYLGLEYENKGGLGRRSGNFIDFILSFQFHYVIIVQGLGRVYSQPVEHHPGAYCISTQQGWLFQ